LIAGATVAGAALFFSGALAPLSPGRSDAAAPAGEAQPASVFVPGLAQSTGEAIAALRARLRERPDDAALYAQLGLTYLREARDAADPSVLPEAEDALRRSLHLDTDENLPAFVGMAALANARHDFSGSVRWSRRAIETNPHNASAYGLLGDALFELGRIRAADAAYQEMVSRRPDVASYVRASYALQHRGNTRAALRAMRLALQAAGPTGESAAWVRHQMGDVYAGLGKIGAARRHNRIGAALAPGFVPPTVGVAESLVARGRLRRAIPIMERAAEKLPALEYLTTLGELYDAVGREDDAARAYRAVATKLADHRAAGVLPDADFIVFYADHGLRPDAALDEAFAIYRDRPTPKVADALAWMLHAVGRDRAALAYARSAIAAPRRDSSILFHTGMIARSLGRDRLATTLLRKALDLDPRFSVLQAPVARRVLAASGAEGE
jgi:tetratricopeptide (TPR) repeat protein